MSGRNVIYLILLAFMALSCRGVVTPGPDAIEEEEVRCRVTIRAEVSGTAATRAEKQTAAEKKITRLDVFVYDASGAFQARGTATDADGVNLVTGITLPTLGAKTVHVFCNCVGSDLDFLESSTQAECAAFASTGVPSEWSDAAVYGSGGFIMHGSQPFTVTGPSHEVSVDVMRYCSKVMVTEAPVFSGAAAGATLQGIYLINVPKYPDPSRLAQMWNRGNGVATAVDPEVADITSASGASSWSVPVYGYPNPSAEAASGQDNDYVTKLVLKVSLSGDTHWYPIGIPGMLRNKRYLISGINISRTGSSNPNDYVMGYPVTADITVLDWIEGDVEGEYNGGVDPGSSPDPDSYVLSAGTASLTYDWRGAASDGVLEVTSSKTYGGVSVAAPWVTMVWDGADWVALSSVLSDPDYAWLSGFPVSSAGITNIQTSKTFYPSVPAREVMSHEDRLKELSILSADGSSVVDNSAAANAVDLSMYDFVQRKMETSRYTANCYVVSSPGWYLIPLVYGNAIENGSTATTAYRSGTLGAGHLNNFKNYKYDLDIADPWIEQDWYAYLIKRNTVVSVRLQWERWSHWDEGTQSVVTTGAHTPSAMSGVITDLSIVSGGDGRYIRFRVDPDRIRPGSALIAALDAGGDSSDEMGDSGALVMWSWHIWITGQDLSTVSVNNGSSDYDVLPVNAGWTDGTKGLYYAPRSARLRFDSTEVPGLRSGEVTVTQTAHEDASVTGWAPYYQWGNKNPFVEGLYTYRPENDVAIRGIIRYPSDFNSEVSTYAGSQKYYDWSVNNYDNLWDSRWTDYGVTSGVLPNHKTVLDPSPRRFCVAPENAWLGFASYGHDGGYVNGYHFYTGPARTSTIFFPASGHISREGVLVGGYDSRYWGTHAAQSMQARKSYGLRFTPYSVSVAYEDYNHRATGQAVRPVRYN